MGTADEAEPVVCCLCREEVSPSGWCHNCRVWPINITPIRYCNRAHRVNPDGWCQECAAFVATELSAENGEWRDTQQIPKALTKAEVQRLARLAGQILSGLGWPEREVPFNRRFIPRRWKGELLKELTRTPNGDEVVIPHRCVDDAEVPRLETEVPF